MREFVLAMTLIAVTESGVAWAQSPGAVGPILPFGPEAAQIRQMDITQRPYRPLHVYGNTVRRAHHRRSGG
jgi:hypothetical protein